MSQPSESLAVVNEQLRGIQDALSSIGTILRGNDGITGIVGKLGQLETGLGHMTRDMQRGFDSHDELLARVNRDIYGDGNGIKGIRAILQDVAVKAEEHEQFVENFRAMMWKVAGVAILSGVASGGIGHIAFKLFWPGG